MNIAGHISPSEWPPSRIQQRVRDLGPWFHNINLGGVSTAPEHFLGDYPSIKWRKFAHAIPGDLRGKTVLDVGCNAGFYSLQMKSRGARRVVGIEPDKTYLAQARFAAEITGLDIDFLPLSVYEVGDLRETFDIVLFLGVLYHLRYPLLALDLLRQHSVGDLLVVQSMLRGNAKAGFIASDYSFDETEIFESPSFPKLHFIENKYAGDETNWWIPNNACLEAILRSSGFAIFDHPEREVYLCNLAPIPDQLSSPPFLSHRHRHPRSTLPSGDGS